MTADSKRRSFPEFAKLLSKEPGWADEESALQGILGAFLLVQLSNVTWPRDDVGYREDGAHVVTLGQDSTGWPVDVRLTVPPQEPVSREDWLVGLYSSAGGALGRKCRELDLGFEVLAEISISEYPPRFRQAYINWLYTTDVEVARWLGKQSRPVVPCLTMESRSKGGSKPKYNAGLQKFIDRLAVKFKDEKKLLTPPTLKAWLVKNAIPGQGFDPTPAILDCDDIEFNGSELLWKDDTGSQKSMAIKSVDRYIQRANNPNLTSAA